MTEPTGDISPPTSYVAAELQVVDDQRVAIVSGVAYPIFGYTTDDGTVVPVLVHGGVAYIVTDINQQQTAAPPPAASEATEPTLDEEFPSLSVSIPEPDSTPTHTQRMTEDQTRIYHLALDRAHALESQMEQLQWTLNAERTRFQEILAIKDRELETLRAHLQEAQREKMTARLEEGALRKRIADLEAGRVTPGSAIPAQLQKDIPLPVTFPPPASVKGGSPDPFGPRVGSHQSLTAPAQVPPFQPLNHAALVSPATNDYRQFETGFRPSGVSSNPDPFGQATQPFQPSDGRAIQASVLTTSREAIRPPEISGSVITVRPAWKKSADAPPTQNRPHSGTFGSARLESFTLGTGESKKDAYAATLPADTAPGSALLPDFRTQGPGPAMPFPSPSPSSSPKLSPISPHSISVHTMPNNLTMGNTPPQQPTQISGSSTTALPPLIPTKVPGAKPPEIQTTIPLDKWEMLNAKGQWKPIYAMLFDSRFFKLYEHKKMAKGVALPLLMAFDFAKCKVSGSTQSGKQAMTIIDENNTKFVLTTDSLDRVALAINCATVAAKSLS